MLVQLSVTMTHVQDGPFFKNLNHLGQYSAEFLTVFRPDLKFDPSSELISEGLVKAAEVLSSLVL